MSKSRYFTAIVVAIAIFVAFNVVFNAGYFEFELLLVSYVVAAFVGDLIFGLESVSGAIFLFFIRWVPAIFMFWLSILLSGVIGFIIGLLGISLCFSAIGFALGLAIGIPCLISSVTFIIHIFSYSRDLY